MKRGDGSRVAFVFNCGYYLCLKDKYTLLYANEWDIMQLDDEGGEVVGYFKKDEVQDERLVNTRNKIYAELYILVSMICGISVTVKYFIYGFDIEHIITELILLFIGGMYFLYRSVRLGVFSAEIELHDRKNKWSMKKKNLVMSVGLGVGIALVMGINSSVQYADGVQQSIYYFFITGFASLMIYLPFLVIVLVLGNEAAKRKSDRVMNKMLDNDEFGDDDEKH